MSTKTAPVMSWFVVVSIVLVIGFTMFLIDRENDRRADCAALSGQYVGNNRGNPFCLRDGLIVRVY